MGGGALEEADAATRLRMRALSEDCLQQFVSLAQSKVGRSRNASWTAGSGGERTDLAAILAKIEDERIDGFAGKPPA